MGLSTVFMAVLMLILVITISAILFFTLHSFGYATQEGLYLEEERMREKIALISLTTENVSGTEYVTSLLVNNTGSITCRIRGIYIDSEFLCNPAEFTNTYLNIAENKRISIPADKWPIYQPTSIVTISTERGIKSTEYEYFLKEGSKLPPAYETKFYFGPLMLDFDKFYYTECNSSGFYDSTSWKPGWKVEIGSGSIVWNITVKNVDYRNITINQFSCFTLFPNKSPSNRRAWYLEPPEATYSQFIQVNETVHLIYIWDRAKLENPKPQDIYSTESRCKVFLTFFGIFHEPDGTTKPYGQTIPFEAVLCVPPPLSISANPQVLLYPGNTSTITVSVNENGIPLENANVSFTTDLGTLSASWALTTGDGRASVILYYSGSAGTATVTATWQGTSESTTVVMNAVPIANFIASAPTVLTNEPINFDASASYDPDGTIVSYNWDFGDGTTATGIIITHTYSYNGTYAVTLSVTDNYGATASVTEIITVFPPPLSISANPQILLYPVNTSAITATVNQYGLPLENANVTFTTTLGTLSASWAFTIADGSATVTLYYSGLPGTAIITATWQGTSESTTVVMNAVPIANFIASAPTVLTNEPINFDASASYDPDGTIVSYNWDFGDGTDAAGIMVTHAYTDGGVYTVNLTIIDDKGATSSTIDIITVLNQPPVPSFTINGSANETVNISINNSVAFDGSASYDPDGLIITYYWDFGDDTNATGPSLDHIYTNAGTFYVTLKVTDDDGETITSDAKTVVVG